MRWNRLCGALALVLVVNAGCKQRLFMTEADYNRTTTTLLEQMETRPDLGAQPITEPVPAPPTMNNLDRKVRYISLAECIAIALESGRVGQFNILFPGTANDNLVQFTGNGVTGSDAIRVFALDPARTGAAVEHVLAKFDAQVVSSLIWNTTDQPIGTPLQTFQAGASNLNSINSQEATGAMSLVKPLASGGVAGITFNMPYQYTNLPARVNPSYRPSIQFGFEQPLLQGFGVELNQLRGDHPGAALSNLPGGNPALFLNQGLTRNNITGEGILITRLRFDQSRAEFERQLNQMLLNVEVAYWNLYGGYMTHYSREEGVRFAHKSWVNAGAKFAAGQIAASAFANARGQYEQLRAQRLQAVDQVLEYERQLRSLIGIPIEDGTRLVPSDSPTLTPYQPDWSASLAEALEKRPELYMVRQEIKAAQYNLILQKNNLLPDLRLAATWDTNSIGTRLDGSSTPTVTRNEFTGAVTGSRDSNALRALSEDNFHSWQVGLRMFVPIGYRQAYANVRRAQIELAKNIEILKDQELKVQSYMANYYRRISLNYETIRAARATREAFGEEVRASVQLNAAGKSTINEVLDAQRKWADAVNSEFQAIVQYNNALAGWEFAKGTIQHHNNVVVAEGPLPQHAAVRAVDHQAQRTAALVLRERALPTPILPGAATATTADGRAPTLPSVYAANPPLQDAPQLPTTIEAFQNAQNQPLPEATFPAPPPAVLQVPPTTSAAPAAAPKKPVTGRRETDFGTVREEDR